MSEKEIKHYHTWIDLDFDFSSIEMTLQVNPDGQAAVKFNGLIIDAADSVEALRDDSFGAVCRAVHEWIEDEVWGFIDDAVNTAWDDIESDKSFDDEEDDDDMQGGE